MTYKLSFKRGERATGLARVANPYAHVTIKADRRQCGTIFPPSWHGDSRWKVVLRVVRPVAEVTADQPCPWKNVTLKFRGDTEQQVRDFLEKNWATICLKFNLYLEPK